LPVLLACTLLGTGGCERAARPTTVDATAAGVMTVRGIPDLPDEVSVVDGQWVGEPVVPGSASRSRLQVVQSTLVAADVDTDGVDESFGVVVAATGGTGSFYYLAAFRPDGAGMESTAITFLGDRVEIEDLVIEDNTVRVDLVEHGDGDPMCCPTRKVSRHYALVGSRLVPAPEVGVDTSERLWGHVVWSHETRHLEACDGSRLWLIDGVTEVTVADLYREFATAEYAPVFFDVEVRRVDVPDAGFAADYEQAVEIVDIFRVEREGFGCRLPADGLLLLGFGNEPGWRLDLGESGATFTSLAIDTGASALEVPGLARVTDDDIAFDSTDGTLAATARKQPCRDTMSGTFFSHTVEVRHNDRLLSGCGVPGRGGHGPRARAPTG
jgi:uncharacterized membrane protein